MAAKSVENQMSITKCWGEETAQWLLSWSQIDQSKKLWCLLNTWVRQVKTGYYFQKTRRKDFEYFHNKEITNV